jgi:hypothetical protein
MIWIHTSDSGTCIVFWPRARAVSAILAQLQAAYDLKIMEIAIREQSQSVTALVPA